MATKKAAKKATKKSAAKGTAKRATQAGRTRRRRRASDPPITIKGGSLKIHYKRDSFNHGGDEDTHKDDVTLEKLVVYRGGMPYRWMSLGSSYRIYICYTDSTCPTTGEAPEC